jgi:hypothetical protein
MARWKAILSSPMFQYPVILLLVLVATSGWYYSFAVKRSETEVNERSLHVLAAISQEFSSRLAALESIARQNWPPSRSGELRGQVPELVKEDCGPDVESNLDGRLRVSGDKLYIVIGESPRKVKSGTPSSVNKVAGDSQRNALPTLSCWSISFSRMMYSMEDSVPKGAFEDLLLADAKGRVLFQTRHSGMDIADLHPFFDASQPHKSKVAEKHKEVDSKKQQTVDSKSTKRLNDEDQETESIEKRQELATVLATSRLTDVDLGGERYKLYTVPVSRPSLTNESSPINFIVGGVLHEHAFQAERVRPLENTLVTIGFFVLLVATGAYPVLRFRLMGATEILKERTGFVFALQVLFSTILVGGLAGHLMFSHYADQTDGQLRGLATHIERNLTDETRAALVMLTSLEGFYEEHHAMVSESSVAGKTCSDDLDFIQPKGKYDWTSNVLDKIGNPDQYPYFDHAYFADGAGFQEIKFSARNSVTPEVRLCDSKAFSHRRDFGDLWHFREGPRDPGFWIEPGYSLTSGRYLAFISRPSSKILRQKAPLAGIGTGLISVSQPVLPPEYGFAIVDREGKVLFHSTPAKNGRENFADACEQTQRLRILFETQESGILETSYLGIRHRVLVQPIRSLENCPWSLVVFRDLTMSGKDHFDSVLLFYVLSSIYVILVAVAGWCAGLAGRPANWIWPNEENRPVYWRIFWVLILVNVFNSWLFLNCDGTQLWVTACTIPFIVATLAAWKLKSKEKIKRLTLTPGLLWLITAFWAWQHDASGQFCLAFTCLYIALACLALPSGLLDSGLAGLRKGADGKQERTLSSKSTGPSLATVYALPATVLIFTIGFIPALRLFNASVLFQSVVAARRSQLELAHQLEERRERISEAFLGSYGEEEPAKAAFLRQRLDETRDLYYLDSVQLLYLKEPHLRPQRLEQLLLAVSSTILEGVQRDGSSPRDRSDSRTANVAWEWCENGRFPDKTLLLRVDGQTRDCDETSGELTGDLHNTWILSTLPTRVVPGLETGASLLVFFETILMLSMVIAAFFALRDAIKRLFALDWTPPEPWPQVEISPGMDLSVQLSGRQSVLLGMPRSGKTEALRQCTAIHYVDLVDGSRSDMDFTSAKSETLFVLDHFEYCLEHPSHRQRVLCLLHRLVYELKCKVIIVTNVDPLYYFDRLAKTTDVDRWTKVLAGFRVIQGTHGRLNPTKESRIYLWQTCTIEERLTLLQLAKYGWVNYLQEPSLTHLFQRGLIEHGSTFEVADPEFADYIKRTVCEEHLLIPDQGGSEEALSALRIVLIMASVAFVAALAYVWGEQMVAYVVTGASALTAASRTLAKSKGRMIVGPEDPGIV